MQDGILSSLPMKAYNIPIILVVNSDQTNVHSPNNKRKDFGE